MMERFFPPIDEDVLIQMNLARRLAADDEEYLSDTDCPYSDDLKALLSPMRGGGGGGAIDVEAIDLEQEILTLQSDLKQYGGDLKASDTAEKSTYFRLMTSLLEKITTLKERTHNLKQIAEFERVLMEIMDDILSPDQRTAVMQRLREVCQ